MSTKNQQSGFTLIELIVVIVILGILAAFALPRFVDLQTDARVATVSGLNGSVKAAAALVYSKTLVTGLASSSAATVSIGQGQSVTTAYGYPDGTSTGIGNALQDTSGFTVTYGNPTTFALNGASNPAQCAVLYYPSTGTSTTASTASVTTGCS